MVLIKYRNNWMEQDEDNRTCAQLDDHKLIDRIYTEHRDVMFRTVRRYITDPETCQDLVQDGIVKLFQKIDVLREKDAQELPAYLVAVMKNISIDYLRHQKVEQNYLDGQTDILPAVTVEEVVLAHERSDRLLQLLEQLPKEEFLLLQGRYLLEYTYAELAQQLGCKEGTIRMKLTRARRHALKLLTENNEEGEEPI